MKTLYKDHLVQLTDKALRIHHYYFPLVSKTIPLSDIEEIVQKPATLTTGKWRIWGTLSPDIWYACDWKRPRREAIFIVRPRNKRLKIGFTVENFRKFSELISQMVPFHQVA